MPVVTTATGALQAASRRPKGDLAGARVRARRYGPWLAVDIVLDTDVGSVVVPQGGLLEGFVAGIDPHIQRTADQDGARQAT